MKLCNLAVLVCLSLGIGCVSSSSVSCADGHLCPNGTACDSAHDLCVLPLQLTVCDGLAEGAPCVASSVTGNCTGGVCLRPVCGDGIVEFGEACDDGNEMDGDGCSANCKSDELCGNGIIDSSKGEQCDDNNHLDHDGCSSACLIETPMWIQRTLAPPARDFGAVAYDSKRQRIVMFGGAIAGIPDPLGDTWEWSGGEWMQISTAGAPSARATGGMAFDSAHGTTVLFGGVNSFGYFADTWLWNGSSWTALDLVGPSARGATVMVYDSKRQRVVLFGGRNSSLVGVPPLADTWEWDGTTWTQIQTIHSPPPRQYASGAYDPARGVVVIAGGEDPPGVPEYADTWAYDGTDWTNVTPAGMVPSVIGGRMAFDITTQQVVLYGGNIGSVFQSTTWGWNGTTWSTITSGIPTARTDVQLAASATGLVMFGGATTVSNNETWSFANGAWTQTKDPGPREDFVMVNDPVRARAIAYGGSTSGTTTRAGDTWELSTSGWAQVGSAPPAAREGACFAYDFAHDNIVQFGGTTGAGTGTAVQETWIWNGSAWAQSTPAQSPSARTQAACAYDGHGVTLFSGAPVGAVPTNDAWTWDGTTWTPAVTPPPGLVGRSNAAAAYDPIRKQMVMFGGIGPTNLLLDDTWVYDGTAWTQVAAGGVRPPARDRASLAWNAARQTLVLVGGRGSSASALDAYEWDGTRWHTIAAEFAPLGRSYQNSVSSLDGAGIIVYGGIDENGNALGDRWELRWQAPHASDICNATDLDGDTLVACADPDCWWVCAPMCPPGTTCDPTAATCGDGVCDATRESCRTCPADCTCASVCGDSICDPGETGCPGDCP